MVFRIKNPVAHFFAVLLLAAVAVAAGILGCLRSPSNGFEALGLGLIAGVVLFIVHGVFLVARMFGPRSVS